MSRNLKELLGQDILLIMGGFHLARMKPADIEAVISDLSQLSRYVSLPVIAQETEHGSR
jgi:metal-dependent hydrolase (beta-lactamase superfamily II)